jgi:hypothetical protein
MFPKAHVITSGSAVLAYALILGLPPAGIVVWVVLASAATVLIDVDHILIQLAIRERRPVAIRIITHPFDYLDVGKLQRALHYEGFGTLRMKVHLAEVLAAAVFCLLVRPPYASPVLLSLFVHLVCDLYEMTVDPDAR